MSGTTSSFTVEIHLFPIRSLSPYLTSSSLACTLLLKSLFSQKLRIQPFQASKMSNKPWLSMHGPLNHPSLQFYCIKLRYLVWSSTQMNTDYLKNPTKIFQKLVVICTGCIMHSFNFWLLSFQPKIFVRDGLIIVLELHTAVGASNWYSKLRLSIYHFWYTTKPFTLHLRKWHNFCHIPFLSKSFNILFKYFLTLHNPLPSLVS